MIDPIYKSRGLLPHYIDNRGILYFKCEYVDYLLSVRNVEDNLYVISSKYYIEWTATSVRAVVDCINAFVGKTSSKSRELRNLCNSLNSHYADIFDVDIMGARIVTKNYKPVYYIYCNSVGDIEIHTKGSKKLTNIDNIISFLNQTNFIRNE